jgi:hypothetical protein
MIEILPPKLLAMLRNTPGLERSYLVGGCVRDWLLGVPVHDFDIEVYGVDYHGAPAYQLIVNAIWDSQKISQLIDRSIKKYGILGL